MGKRMGKYLLYSEDLAGFVALNVLKAKQHQILGVIDCSGRSDPAGPASKGSPSVKTWRSCPHEALNQVDGIMIGVATEPLATQLKKELKAKFPQKKDQHPARTRNTCRIIWRRGSPPLSSW